MSNPSDPPNTGPEEDGTSAAVRGSANAGAAVAGSEACPTCGHLTNYLVCGCGRYYDRQRFLELPLSPMAGAVAWRTCPCESGIFVAPCAPPSRARDRGDWMQTYTGRVFYPLDPHPEAVCIADIAHALAQQCRYAGHSLFHYSVAQHSVLVSTHVPREHAVWGLMHDAAEAYLVDLPRPVKHSVVGYDAAEERVLEAVAERFGLSLPMPDAVRIADNQALATEQRDVMRSCGRPWSLTEEPWSESVAARRRVDLPRTRGQAWGGRHKLGHEQHSSQRPLHAYPVDSQLGAG
jgi:hypothetical protein